MGGVVRVKHSFIVAVFGLGLLAPAALAASSRLQPAQEQRLQALFKQSERLEHDGEVVKAYSVLHEAARLEQLWTNNTGGADALSSKRLNRFILAMIRRDDASVQRILHSRQIELGDKLGLIHVLEQDVLVNFPGKNDAGLISGYDE